jgi:hypothetical protein
MSTLPTRPVYYNKKTVAAKTTQPVTKSVVKAYANGFPGASVEMVRANDRQYLEAVKAQAGGAFAVMEYDHGRFLQEELTDAESNFGRAKLVVQGRQIPILQSGAGSHEPVVERAVRVVKERCRAIIAALPFTVPRKIVPFMVKYVCNRVNMSKTSKQ